jgi:hypothetical protein
MPTRRATTLHPDLNFPNASKNKPTRAPPQKLNQKFLKRFPIVRFPS